MSFLTQGVDLQSFSLRQLLDLADTLQIDCEGVESKAQIISLIKAQAENDNEQEESSEDEQSPKEEQISVVWRKSKSKQDLVDESTTNDPSSPRLDVRSKSEGNNKSTLPFKNYFYRSYFFQDPILRHRKHL
jgi:hypothetical protein